MQIYTDGSCHTQLKIGAWAAVILWNNHKVELLGHQKETTHNAMELLGVLESIKYIQQKKIPYTHLEIITDSQYVANLSTRIEKLKKAHFLTKKKVPIRNVMLVKQLIQQMEDYPISFVKVKAHTKKTSSINYNRVVDMAARREVRRLVEATLSE